MTTPIAVVIITRERREDVVRAVRSVLADIGPYDSVHVLENGCVELSTEGLDALFPDVQWHREPENLGVPGGRNRLVELSSEPVVAFVDDDATLEPGSLNAVRSAFDADEMLGAVAFRIDDPATGLPRSHEYPFRGTSDVDVDRPATYFVGAGFALRRRAIDEVGEFDDRLFYALEELDWSFAAIGAGWKLRYVPSARVVHHASPAGRPTGQKVYFMVRHRIVVAYKWLPLRYAVSHMVLWGGVWFSKAVRARQLRHFWKGIRDGWRMARESDRRVLSRDAISRLKELGGRLWF
jgi:GT2 family glycosyltransferase